MMRVFCIAYEGNMKSFSIWKDFKDYFSSEVNLKWYCPPIGKHGLNFVSSKVFRCINEFKPTHIWNLSPHVMATEEEHAILQQKDIKLINFPRGFADPNLFLEKRLRCSDLYVTNNRSIYKLYQGVVPMYYFQNFCNPEYHKRLNLEKTIPCSFIGSGFHPHLKELRFRLAHVLVASGLQVYGKHWGMKETYSPTNRKKWAELLDGLHINSFVEGERIVKIINKTHLTVDLTSSWLSTAHRLFESSCCGTPCITKRCDEVQELFEEDKEILFYDSEEDLVSKVSFYLKHKDILARIGENAHQRCLREHTSKHRFGSFLQHIRAYF